MWDQPRSQARSPRREDEEAQKKDHEQTNKGQSCSWHRIALCASDNWHRTTLFASDRAPPYFLARDTLSFFGHNF